MGRLGLADADATPELFGLVCYHAQQAAEKALKATLVARGLPFPYVHNLITLCKSAELARLTTAMLRGT